MHLRHIDPRSTDWMDAMDEEGLGARGAGREAEAADEASGDEGPAAAEGKLSAPGEARMGLMAAAVSRR